MKTIILDFDGTIADTFKISLEIAHNLTGHESLLDSKEVSALKQVTMVEVVERLGIPKLMIPFLLIRGRKQMAKRLNEVKPFSGIDEVLAGLHIKGYRVFIMSSNSQKNISRFLTSHGLRAYVQKIYGGVGLLSKSAALRKIMKQNKLSPSDVVYVGDEIRDIEASKNANIPVIAVTWGFNDSKRLIDEKPTAIVRTRADLLRVLLSLEKS